MILEHHTSTLRVFRSTLPTKKHYDYLDKIEAKMSGIWKEMGIFDLIQLSRNDPLYFQNMLVASHYYWKSTTNTFQLPCRMLTPTIFDVAAITGLRPDGGNFDPNEQDKDNVEFDNARVGFTRYIGDYHVTDTPEVSAKEHIAFLALWLSRYVF